MTNVEICFTDRLTAKWEITPTTCRNRLIETKAADGTVTAYTYDAENTRLTEETENTRHTFVTDKETTYSQLLTETAIRN